MTVTLGLWMCVPASITSFWLVFALRVEDRDMVGFSVIAWLAMIAPALLVAWLK